QEPMFAQLTAVVIDATPANREEMVTFLTAQRVEVQAALPNVDTLDAILSAPAAPKLVVVTLDPTPWEVLKQVGVLIRRFHDTQFFVLSHTVDPKLLMDAIRQGVSEFIPLPVDEEQFSAAVERVKSKSASDSRSRLIHILPTAGGCGATTIACNVAATLAKKGPTLLIDLDLVSGAVAGNFDIRPRYTIADLMHSTEKIDRQLVESAIVQHASSGLSILARPDMPEESQRVTAAGFSRLLNV